MELWNISIYGGAYNSEIGPLQNLLNKILSRLQDLEASILNIRKTYQLNSLLYHYEKLTILFEKNSSRTRNNSLEIPKIRKEAYKKAHTMQQ